MTTSTFLSRDVVSGPSRARADPTNYRTLREGEAIGGHWTPEINIDLDKNVALEKASRQLRGDGGARWVRGLATKRPKSGGKCGVDAVDRPGSSLAFNFANVKFTVADGRARVVSSVATTEATRWEGAWRGVVRGRLGVRVVASLIEGSADPRDGACLAISSLFGLERES